MFKVDTMSLDAILAGLDHIDVEAFKRIKVIATEATDSSSFHQDPRILYECSFKLMKP